MNRKRVKRFLITAISLFILPSFTVQDTGILTIKVTGLRNNKGSVLVAIYNNAKNFPEDAGKYAFANGKADIVNSIATIGFKDIPYGRYAVAILHDENSNVKMDFTMIGLPKEGYGFSNNAKGIFGAPSFAKAAFDLNTANKSISMKMHY